MESFDAAVSSKANLSGKYLQELFCHRMDQLEGFYDLHMQMVDANVLKGDKSYKVCKVVYKDGVKAFDSLYTVMNERNQIVAQYFTRTASMKEVETILTEIKERLVFHGHGEIELIYTDDCCHEYPMVSRVFNNMQDERGAIVSPGSNDIPPSQLPKVTVSDEGIHVQVLDSLELVDSFGQQLVAEALRADDVLYVGFDCEWLKDDPESVPQTIQLATKSGEVGVIQTRKAFGSVSLPKISNTLKTILASPKVQLVGVSVKSDINAVCKHWDSLVDSKNGNFIDLGVFARSLGVVRGGGSAQYLTAKLLRKFLSKDDHIRCSDWSRTLLRQEQIEYAGLDAYIGPLLMEALRELERVHRIPKAGEDFTSGQCVRIFNKGGSCCVGLAVIADIHPQEKCSATLLEIYRPSTKLWLGESKGKKLGDFKVGDKIEISRTRMRLASADEKANAATPARTSTNNEADNNAIPGQTSRTTGTNQHGLRRRNWRHNRLKLDIFHAKQRITDAVKTTHGCYLYFCKLLSEAFFITSPEDWDLVREKVVQKVEDDIKRLKQKGVTEKEIAKRVRRELKKNRVKYSQECRRNVPSPDVLEKRLESVVRVFANVRDAKTGEAFFSQRAWKEYKALLRHVQRGCLSDHPDVNLYYRVGNQLHCIRGTSCLEGYHYHVRKIIQQYQSTPELCIKILRMFNYRWNIDRLADREMLSPSYANFYQHYLLEEMQVQTHGLFEEPIIPDWESSRDVFGTGGTFYHPKDVGMDADDCESDDDEDFDSPIQKITGNVENEIYEQNLQKFLRRRLSSQATDTAPSEDRRSCYDPYDWSKYADWWNNTLVKENESVELEGKRSIFRKTAAILKEHFQTRKKRLNSVATLSGLSTDGSRNTVFDTLNDTQHALQGAHGDATAFHPVIEAPQRQAVALQDDTQAAGVNSRPVGVAPLVVAGASSDSWAVIDALVGDYQHARVKRPTPVTFDVPRPKRKRYPICRRCGLVKMGDDHQGDARKHTLAYCSDKANWLPPDRIPVGYACTD